MSQLPDAQQRLQMSPAALLALRDVQVAAIIDAAPRHRRKRLAGLQCEIDLICQAAPTPLAATIKVSAMMQERFSQLHAALNEVGTQARSDDIRSGAASQGAAKILRFPSVSGQPGAGRSAR